MTGLLSAVGVILILLGVLAFVGVLHFATVGAGGLIVAGLICCVVAYFLGGARSRGSVA